MAALIDPQLARDFAVDVVRRLRAAGHQALWAGGCVRDRLLSRPPLDYDVATDAEPPQVRQLFGRRRTLAIGQAFGVICVLGPPGAGQIEVATFRRDAEYSDGRHPDGVTFSTAEEDALRRDFTINGLFYDPLGDQLLDYVGGRQDLERKLVRAIGDPHQRLSEDKLRMLRAVRFAATFDFQIEAATLQAIRDQAGELVIVSAERITAELRRMLVQPQRRRAVELLGESGLLPVLFPEAGPGTAPEPPAGPAADWNCTLRILEHLNQPLFSAALAALIRDLVDRREPDLPDLQTIAGRLRLSNQEIRETQFCLTHETLARRAREVPWSRLQKILVQPESTALLNYAEAVAAALDRDLSDIEFCRQKLSLPPAELDPPPLITGDDLRAAGFPPGPRYGPILSATRDAQLDGHIVTRGEALQLARELFTKPPA